MGLFLMVLAFVFWWPLGLIISAALVANGRIGYRRRLQFAGNGPMGDDYDYGPYTYRPAYRCGGYTYWYPSYRNWAYPGDYNYYNWW